MFRKDLLFWLFRPLLFPSRRRQKMDSQCWSTMKRRYRIECMRPFYNKPTGCFRYDAILQQAFMMFQVWCQPIECSGMRPSNNKPIGCSGMGLSYNKPIGCLGMRTSYNKPIVCSDMRPSYNKPIGCFRYSDCLPGIYMIYMYIIKLSIFELSTSYVVTSRAIHICVENIKVKIMYLIWYVVCVNWHFESGFSYLMGHFPPYWKEQEIMWKFYNRDWSIFTLE